MSGAYGESYQKASVVAAPDVICGEEKFTLGKRIAGRVAIFNGHVGADKPGFTDCDAGIAIIIHKIYPVTLIGLGSPGRAFPGVFVINRPSESGILQWIRIDYPVGIMKTVREQKR